MALFQKKEIAGSSVPLYTLGLAKTVLLVGLGNPGKEYDGTRHNVGFACLEAFVSASGFSDWVTKKDLKSLMSSGTVGSTRVIAIEPTTFMNRSGEAVQATAAFYKILPKQIVVIHDELDIPFGQIRTRPGGGSAGHNGIKSLLQHMDENFGRLRIGVRNDIADQADSADFVLGKFTKDEKSHLAHLTRETTAILTEYLVSDQLPAETRTIL